MFYSDGRLQYGVRVDKPNPLFARALQQAIGGVEGTDDSGMKDMLSFNIARDTMHQQQRLAVIEELGGFEGALPIPNSFPQAKEHAKFSYTFIDPRIGKDAEPLTGRFTTGRSLDGNGEFRVEKGEPYGTEPTLAAPKPSGFAQKVQMAGGAGVLGTIKHALTGGA